MRVQLPEQAEQIQSQNGSKTLLPFALSNLEQCSFGNALQNNREIVQYLANCPMVTEDCPAACFVAAHNPSLLQRIQEGLSVGCAVIIKITPMAPTALDIVYLENEFGLSSYQKVPGHGKLKYLHCFLFVFRNCTLAEMCLHSITPTYPHVIQTLGHFINSVYKPDLPGCVLDLPLSHMSPPCSLKLV